MGRMEQDIKPAKYDLGQATKCFEVPITRRDVKRMIMLESPVIRMYAGVLSESAIPEAIEFCLQTALKRDGCKPDVFVNSNLSGPTIKALVRFAD